MKYLALLRGINVGGSTLIKMADLKVAVQGCGYQNVKTYINSGNVIFESAKHDTGKISKELEACIAKTFNHSVGVVVFSKTEWQKIIDSAPTQWGDNPNWRYNLLVLLQPYDMEQAIESIGELKPEVEFMVSGEGVLYQGNSTAHQGSTRYSRIAAKPIYKQMTIRNYNTSTKLLNLFD